MKKILLLVAAWASLVFVADATTYMRVKTTDGSIIKYDVEEVVEVDFTGSEDTVLQLTESGEVDKYSYVDLGLKSGTLWATYNVGASSPAEIGDYFAWGETLPKAEYSIETYKWSNGRSNVMTKYSVDQSFGSKDSLLVLLPADDAATANWGSGWRMPTTEEQMELKEGCDWTWVDNFNDSGISGRIGVSKVNGNAIFFPAGGYRDYLGPEYVFSRGYYWSSSLLENVSYYAYEFLFYKTFIDWFSDNRFFGMNVRAVVAKP